MAYLVFEDVYDSKKFTRKLNGNIKLNSKYYRFEYAPEIESSEAKTIHKIEDNVVIHDDWLCSKVSNLLQKYKCSSVNFSRREACFKCGKIKTKECKIVPYVKQKKVYQDAPQPSSILIVKCCEIKDLNETEVKIY